MEVADRHVMILRAPAEDVDEGRLDPYSSLLGRNGFTVTSIPAIDFEFCNLEELRDCLQSPEKFSGIILTSPRAVRAVALSVAANKQVLAQWNQHSYYVVGKTTADALKVSLGVDGEGAECGSALSLANYITTHSRYGSSLLYPCSSLQRGTLSDRLSEHGVDTHCVIVYNTVCHPQLEEALTTATTPQYIVFFSPSGVNASLPVLRRLRLPLQHIKILAIGSTTKTALEKSDVRVWSVCQQPTPEHLLRELSTPNTS